MTVCRSGVLRLFPIIDCEVMPVQWFAYGGINADPPSENTVYGKAGDCHAGARFALMPVDKPA